MTRIKKIKNKVFFSGLLVAALFIFCFIFCVHNIYAITGDSEVQAIGDKIYQKNDGKWQEAVMNEDGTEFKAYIDIKDDKVKKQLDRMKANDDKDWTKQFWYWLEDKGYLESASAAFWSAVSSTLNTMAYDTAKWIGSGGEGQKPVYLTEDPGVFLSNIADNTAGYFIEQLGKEWNFNLCKPSFAVKLSISLGLVEQQRPKAPACTFSEMKKNWEEALNDPDFLPKFQDMFEPTSNDLGIALSLQTKSLEDIDLAKNNWLEKIKLNEGWLNVENIAGVTNGLLTKDQYKYKMQTLSQVQANNVGTFTGTLRGAANVFLNQLAISAFNKLLEDLNNKDISITSKYSGDYGGLLSYEAGPTRTGTTETEEKLKKILEPNFTTRSDYNILADLTSCPDPNKAKSTNCVITEKFRQAIENKLTVEEAIIQGYLDGNANFGYLSTGLEPSYEEGYPYRSIIILRKYRILPVGWELAAQKIKELGKAYTLKQITGCFDSSDATCIESGLKGLVDPGWVLKAPQNYCKKEGPGPELLSTQVTGEGSNSSLSILRNSNYCGDEQSCIKENDDGSCKYYGYCTEEKRIWKFNSSSCEPQYNTCQTFKASDGQTISYLKNTLEYCDTNAAGCAEYATDYNYSQSKWNDSGSKIYLNSKTESCEASNEGCRELIRTKIGLGTNLITNPGFENELDGWNSSIATTTDSFEGALSVTAEDFTLYRKIDVGKNSINSQYVFSFYAKNCSGGQYSLSVEKLADGTCVDGDCAQTISDVNDSNWYRHSISYNFKIDNPGNELRIAFKFPATAGCVIDALQLEEGSTATPYKDYVQANVIYEKLMPAYLASYCQANSSASDCIKYANYCAKEDVGCELYTSQTDGTAIPAKISTNDVCDSTCVGYDSYVQRESIFDSRRDNYFIPDNKYFANNTVRTCSAEAAGCDEFTNLDKVSAGGEAREYYSYLKQCILPDANSCADYYTWEGSDAEGYQLKVFSLEKGVAGAPKLTNTGTYEGNLCSQESYDTINNPTCQEYYDTAGKIHYAFSAYTMACSNNCHPYRRTENNNVTSAQCLLEGNSASDCAPSTLCSAVSVDSHPVSCKLHDEEIILCRNGGAWYSQHNACVYMAIPDEGKTCSSDQAGCREYSGNKGSNYRQIASYNFDANQESWSGTEPSVKRSTESLYVGSGSLNIKGGDYSSGVLLGDLINSNSAYVLNFLAKATTAGTKLEIYFENSDSATGKNVNNPVKFSYYENGSKSVNTTLTTDWRLYTVNIDLRDYYLTHTIGATERLVVKSDGKEFYIDNIKLIQVIDRYYLIKNSWATPAVCDQDIEGNPLPLFALGCDHYQDRDNFEYYLHSFSELCGDDKVGCELLIDTHNSNNYQSESWQSGSVIIPADNYIYAVYDADKLCNVNDKGCQRLGKIYRYEDSPIYSDVYLRNNPDQYADILCTADEVGCAQWSSDEGSAVFKDPGDMACEWSDSDNRWYKKKIKKCGGLKSGAPCFSDSDCSANTACSLETGSTDACPTAVKTVGTGGSEVYQPQKDTSGNYWAGLCPVSESSCTEYIDPVSSFSSNYLFNGDFSQNINAGARADGWTAIANPSEGTQNLETRLQPNTLYLLSVAGDNTATITFSGGRMWEINSSDNSMQTGTNVITVASETGKTTSKVFYVGSDTAGKTASIKAINSAAGNGSKIEVKKAIVSYRLKQGVNSKDCNGTVDNSKGCVLFNERSISGKAGYLNYKGLIYNAARTSRGASPSAVAEYDSNIILKVSPDRDCDKWLACRSYIYDELNNKVCYDVGLCQNMNEETGNCTDFVIESKTTKINQTYPNFQAVNNLSGYSKVGIASSTYNKVPNDLYNLGQMEQFGESAAVYNGDFEFSGNNYAVGWNYEVDNEIKTWDSNIFSVIDNPFEQSEIEQVCFRRTTEGNCQLYAPEGRNYLRLGASYDTAANVNYNATSNWFSIIGGQNYTLTAYVDTMKITSGSAQISVIANNGQNMIATIPSGKDWTFILKNFNFPGATLIKIKLESIGQDAAGNIYFDDIKISPSLDVQNSAAGGKWYIPQTCRIYPKDDSLSCDYYDDSGTRNRGWYGYCLEYDRAPGNPDNCILWYPIDKVKGQGVEENAGYKGEAPLYYCVKAKQDQIQKNISGYFINEVPITGNDHGVVQDEIHYFGSENLGYTPAGVAPNLVHTLNILGNSSNQIPRKLLNRSILNSVLVTETKALSGGACGEGGEGQLSYHGGISWGIYMDNPNGGGVLDSNKCKTETSLFSTACENGDDCHKSSILWDAQGEAVGIYHSTCEQSSVCVQRIYPMTKIQFNTKEYACDELVETVTPIGENKAWLNRIRPESTYGFSCNVGLDSNVVITDTCSYATDDSPFGSIVPPEPVNNPTLWDGDSNTEGIQPLKYSYQDSPYASGARAGQFQTVDLLRNIFAKSYRGWQWDGSKYASNDNIKIQPATLCPGTPPVRPENTACAIPPIIQKINISPFSIVKNGFANLEFYTSVDDAQEPLVMYQINWGDEENTTVSGVEMRDRPLPSDYPKTKGNPHSLYHLYDYWDLKSKDTKNPALGIDCDYDANGIGQCSITPKIQIKDNWGWCNGDTAEGACSHWVNGSTITVREK
ncbi:MAG: hypothetical protein PHT51_04255 [Patescibacteria group bacterium]|nr:hypothetical protein [Patescibacteria group bacterium]MDD4610749.1 hypothetical protein [Patescibacteria group bacterium]